MNEKRSPDVPQKRVGNGKKDRSSSPHPQPSQTRPDPYAAEHDFLLANGDIDDRLFGDIVKQVIEKRQNQKVVLCLVTYGGQANAAYRIGRFLQSFYGEVVALVPSLCKSAGTLVVTAAHKVVMSVTGEIGPLDVQLSQGR